MMILLDVEIRRVLARRLTRVVGALLLVGVAGMAVVAVPAARERARIRTDAAVEECVQGETVELPVAVDTPGEIKHFCTASIPARDPRFHLAELPDVFTGASALLIILGWLIGASAVGAEWHSGTMTTTLTWEARRARVAIAKVASVAVVSGTGALLWQMLAGGALIAPAALAGTTEGTSLSWLGGVIGTGARIAALVCVAAAAGSSIALIGRSTAAALSFVFAYVFLLENNFLWSYFRSFRQWLLLGNTLVFLEGKPLDDVPGRSAGAAGVWLLVYIGCLFAVALAVMRRRDVT